MTFDDRTRNKVAQLVKTEGRPRKKPAGAKAISKDNSTQVFAEGDVYFIDDQGRKRENKRQRPRRRKTAHERMQAGRPRREGYDRREMMLRRTTDWADWTMDRLVRIVAPAILITVVYFLERW